MISLKKDNLKYLLIMDDFSSATLLESRNEWASRLINMLTPVIIDGFRSIFEEALKLCNENNEMDKYLMTFQNFITRIPKWNATIIETERKRICDKTGCTYLEDLITCVHIIQLKILTAMRVGQKPKKIDIQIPKLDDFIHKAYINVARKLYKNVYLFERNIMPLQVQKHNRELELIVQESILTTIRENIPIEGILKAYMDESVEEDVTEEVKEQYIEEEAPKPSLENPFNNANSNTNANAINSISTSSVVSESKKENTILEETTSKLKFNDIDYVRDENNNDIDVEAPKTIQRLEEISEIRATQRRLEDEEDDNNGRLNISDQSVVLNTTDFQNISEPEISLLPELLIDNIEILD